MVRLVIEEFDGFSLPSSNSHSIASRYICLQGSFRFAKSAQVHESNVVLYRCPCDPKKVPVNKSLLISDGIIAGNLTEAILLC